MPCRRLAFSAFLEIRGYIAFTCKSFSNLLVRHIHHFGMYEMQLTLIKMPLI